VVVEHGVVREQQRGQRVLRVVVRLGDRDLGRGGQVRRLVELVVGEAARLVRLASHRARELAEGGHAAGYRGVAGPVRQDRAGLDLGQELVQGRQGVEQERQPGHVRERGVVGVAVPQTALARPQRLRGRVLQRLEPRHAADGEQEPRLRRHRLVVLRLADGDDAAHGPVPGPVVAGHGDREDARVGQRADEMRARAVLGPDPPGVEDQPGQHRRVAEVRRRHRPVDDLGDGDPARVGDLRPAQVLGQVVLRDPRAQLAEAAPDLRAQLLGRRDRHAEVGEQPERDGQAVLHPAPADEAADVEPAGRDQVDGVVAVLGDDGVDLVGVVEPAERVEDGVEQRRTSLSSGSRGAVPTAPSSRVAALR
jgi:hypothetical protein